MKNSGVPRNLGKHLIREIQGCPDIRNLHVILGNCDIRNHICDIRSIMNCAIRNVNYLLGYILEVIGKG